ncbi:MAG TPA: cupin domain-containing protein [Bryobacteraceae bacterium]|nr:cupin domain-containing protein [Bryobacteraceae bacterium]
MNKIGFIVKTDEVRGKAPLEIYGDQIRLKLDGRDTGGAYAMFEGIIRPNWGPPLHRHRREDESFYVLEGDFLFEVDGERFLAGPGTTVYAPKGTAHTFQNVGTKTGRILTTVQPAGVDQFFTELDAVSRGMLAPDMSVAGPIFERFGLELLGPPIGQRQKEQEVTIDLQPVA